MIRVVLDTNIVVSAAINRNGHPYRVLNLSLAGLVRLCVSEPILAEYRELLQLERFGIDRRQVALLINQIRNVSLLVAPASRLRVCRDPDDDVFLECAQAAKAKYLVTGNIRDFPLRWKYTTRVTPATFLAQWQLDHSHSRPSQT